jgi:WD40 repeat protein
MNKRFWALICILVIISLSCNIQTLPPSTQIEETPTLFPSTNSFPQPISPTPAAQTSNPTPSPEPLSSPTSFDNLETSSSSTTVPPDAIAVFSLGRPLAFSPDGNFLLVQKRSALTLVNIQSLQPLGQLEIDDSLIIEEVSFNPGGDLLAMLTADSAIYIWDLKNLSLMRRIEYGQWASNGALSWSPDGTLLAVRLLYFEIIVFNTSTWEIILTLNAADSPSDDAAIQATFTKDGESFVVLDESDITFYKVEALKSGKEEIELQIPLAEKLIREIHSAWLFPESGKIVIYDLNSFTTKILDMATTEVIMEFPGIGSIPSPDGTMLAGIKSDDPQTILVWSIETGQIINSFQGHTPTSLPPGAVWSPDSEVLATTTSETILWKVR